MEGSSPHFSPLEQFYQINAAQGTHAVSPPPPSNSQAATSNVPIIIPDFSAHQTPEGDKRSTSPQPIHKVPSAQAAATRREQPEPGALELTKTLIGFRFERTPPWLRGGQKHVSLHQEIEAFCKYLEPTEEEKQMRIDVVGRITNVILDLWPNAEVQVFGSCASDLYLPHSDVDITVLNAFYTRGREPLYALAYELRRRRMSKRLETVGKARVPIIKLTDAVSDCQVDISFGSANGAVNTEIINRFIQEAPVVRPMAIVLKYYLRQLGFNEPYTGGIGSYTLLLMIISYLQLQSPLAKEDQEDLGILICGFLKFYGCEFNYHRTGISVRNGGSYFQKKRKGWVSPDQPWLLATEDPAFPENDVSKSSYAIMEVRESFANAYRSLLAEYDPTYEAPSTLCKILLRDEKMEAYRQFIRSYYGEEQNDDDEQDEQDEDEEGEVPSEQQHYKRDRKRKKPKMEKQRKEKKKKEKKLARMRDGDHHDDHKKQKKHNTTKKRAKYY